jgi:hypothetical protein
VIDSNSDTWRFVKGWADKQLEQHRLALEVPGLPEIETNGRRYAIIELKALLKLAEPSKIPSRSPIEPA